MRVGNLLMIFGALLLVGGAIIRFVPGAVSWFGNLPGDIRIEGETSRVFIPITSMIVTSLVLTVVVNVALSILRGR
jgi:hypothetical protein